jgi:hypothetical protein
VSATGVVAIIGVIATPVVAIAGYVFNRQLARDTHTHELEARRRERACDARRDAYLHVLEWALILIQQVELTDPIITYAGMPAAPESPPAEVFNRMVVELAAFGSAEVRAAVDEFRNAVRSFGTRNNVAMMLRDQGAGGQVVEAFEARDAAREEARAAHDRLATAINQDLANL